MSTYHGILLHVVFSTKLRMPILDAAWRDEMYAYIGGIVKQNEATLLKAGGVEDHIHLLLKTHPSYTISNTIQLLKGNSSKWINDTRKTRQKFQWQAGYGAFSVSQSMADVVKHYISTQPEHHKRQTFQDEYLAILRKHNIEFDPRYVFESELTG